jgi:NAD(P)-dependent dehydrogenase (short-subunit alcohol dehydrogenase family)
MSEAGARHVLVTGASRGIGEAIARALAAEGWRVTLAARSLEALHALRDGLPSAPGAAPVCVALDVTDAGSVERAFAAAREAAGPLHALVNNAGAVETGPTARVPLATWQRMLAVNLTGTFLCTQAALPDLLAAGAGVSAGAHATGGRVVNIASTAAQRGYAYCAAYAAAKHGVLGFTRSLALELATKGVAVNAVCPGYTDTDIVRRGVENVMSATGRDEAAALAGFVASNPMGRLVAPAEVAATVRWLLRDAPASITGQAFSVSGGEVMA